MQKIKCKILYENDNLLVINKTAGINSDDFEKRVHRLDKDTSGILLVAKNDKSLKFFQKQFKERKVKKKYIALVVGSLKNPESKIETLIGRSAGDKRKQKVYLPHEPGSQGKRTAATKYKVLQRFKDYDLIEIEPETGRKHQIRTHFAYLNHPIAGDKMYGFKNQPIPKGLKRHFLHASYLRIQLPAGETKEFKSELPKDLQLCLQNLKNLPKFN
ncbi:MAG: RluA family pseudouridine synthase [Candidatus Nealsonbacteria bacterium]